MVAGSTVLWAIEHHTCMAGSASQHLSCMPIDAGLEKLHVECTCMTHQAMASIAQCTRLTDLYIEERTTEQTCIDANGPNARLSGLLSCMCNVRACKDLYVGACDGKSSDKVHMPFAAPQETCSRRWVLSFAACRSPLPQGGHDRRRTAPVMLRTTCWCPQSPGTVRC